MQFFYTADYSLWENKNNFLRISKALLLIKKLCLLSTVLLLSA